jgi:hypothetical protein
MQLRGVCRCGAAGLEIQRGEQGKIEEAEHFTSSGA